MGAMTDMLDEMDAKIKRLEVENAAWREIGEVVATLKWNLNEDWCLFCGSTLWQDEPENHTEECAITKARELLGKSPRRWSDETD